MIKYQAVIANVVSAICALAGIAATLHAAEEPKLAQVYYATLATKSTVPVGVTGLKVRCQNDNKIVVEDVQAGTPAFGHFSKGDIIAAVNGAAIEGQDSIVVLGAALTQAEAADGILKFGVTPNQGSAPKEVTISVPLLGSYSKTFPLDCKKSKTIISRAADFYSGPDRLKGHNHLNAVACLFLLSTGDEKYVPRVKEYFSQFLKPDGHIVGIGDHTWDNGYNGVACAEYYLRTGDSSVLPILQYYCDDAKKRQLYNAGWGHWGPASNPHYEAGGGMMNPAGNQELLTLVLGRMCGVNVDDKTLGNALRYFYRFIGHGACPISDQRPWCQIFYGMDRAGATAAVMHGASFAKGDTRIYRQAKEYLTMYELTSWPGNLWDTIWYNLTSAYRLEQNAERYYSIRQGYRPLYDIYRLPSGAFFFPSGQAALNDVDAGASVALALTAPLKTLCIGGAPRSKYAKDFIMPEHLWGNDADLAFLSAKPEKNFDKFGKEDDVGILYNKLPIRCGFGQYGPADVKGLPLDMMLKNVRHPNYVIRVGAAKALCMNGQLGELVTLLADPDPRLRRAALDGINDYLPWFDSKILGSYALKAKDYTPAMIDAITAILNNPRESWYVRDGAMLALSHAPVEAVRKNIPAIIPWTTCDDWWLRESAFMALMGLRENEELFVKSLPTLSDMAAKEINFNPHSMMIQELRKALATWKNDSRAGRLILAGFEHAAAGQQKMDQRQLKSNNGNVNFTETVMIVMKESPASAADLAELITTNEGLKELETKDILRILKSENEPTVGLYPSLEGLPPARKSKLTDILFNVFRPELVKRLAAAAGKVDSDLLNAIVDLTRLKTQAAVWQPVGVSSSEGRIWRYCSLNPLTEADKLPPEVGPPRRLRKIALPAGMDRWYSPDFDDSKWKSGRAPIGVGIFKPDGHSHLNPNFAFKNNSDWGDGEFLLARSTFDVRDLDFDYYRIGILANEGYIIYLNGHEIKNYFWFSGSPSYGQFILGKDQMGYLRKGANTLAVYCNLKYEKDRKLEQQYHPIGQMDLVFEGLKKKDLGLAR